MASKPRPAVEYLDVADRALLRVERTRSTLNEHESAYRSALLSAWALGVSEDDIVVRFGPTARSALAQARRERLDGLNGPWPDLSNAAAVERVLREAPGPLRPHEIMLVLDGHGRGESELDVNATLQYLAKWRRAEKTGFAQWVAGAA